MLKADLHTHTGDDPQDRIRYSTRDLIDRAARFGFQVLAVTNHNAVTHTDELAGYAAECGILLMPGLEITVEGAHLLVINPAFRLRPNDRLRLSDVPGLKTPDSLFIAPHPYFVIFQSLGRRVEEILPCLDAIEIGSFHNRLIDFNRPGRRLAARTGLPLLATSDCHTVPQFGRSYALLDAPPTTAGVIEAVKSGRIENHSRPISLAAMAAVILSQFSVRKLARLFGR